MVNKTTRKRGKRGGAGEAGAGAGEAGAEEVAKAEAAKAKKEAEAEAKKEAEAKAEATKKVDAAKVAEATKKVDAAKVAEAAKAEAANAEAIEEGEAKVADGEAKVVAPATPAKAEAKKKAEATKGEAAEVVADGEADGEAAKVREAAGVPGEGKAEAAPGEAKVAGVPGEGEPIVAPGEAEEGAKTPEEGAKTPGEGEEILAALTNKSPEELQKRAPDTQEEIHAALQKNSPEKPGEPGEPGKSGTLESPAIPGTSIVITQEQQSDKVEVKMHVYKGREALKDTIYLLFSSILLLTSYLLFCFATVLFINACININFLNKVVNDKDQISPIAMQPVFDYLKPNNFMFLDKFMLEPQSPVFITFIVIIGVSLACLVLLIVFWSSNANNNDTRFDCWKDSIIPDRNTFFSILKNKNDINEKKKTKETKKFIALLKYLPYLYIFIIFSTYNGITNENRINLENLKKDTFDTNFQDFNTNETFTKEDNKSGIKFLKELKNIIIRHIYNDIPYSNNDSIIDELVSKLDETNAKVKEVINSNIITKTIFDIYGKYYKYKVNTTKNIGDENKLIKHHKLTYINHINNYFNMLINDTEQSEQSKVKAKTNSSPNYYTRFYLIGLIKEEPLNTDYKTNTDHLTTLKTELDNKLTGVKNRIRGYYIAVITFYVLFICLICGFYYKEFGLYILEILVRYKLTNWRAALIIAIVFIILLVYGILFATTNYKV